MNYATVCSGIDSPAVAWNKLGWRQVFSAEIEPFPCAVLKHHYPEVPNYGDVLKYKDWPDASVDVLCAGTPCQAFSVAGLRAGLADPRGNLTLVFLGMVEKLRPTWVIWENVPGVLSDKTGAFGAFLGGLAKFGYGFAYRILDAQYAGLAQRRERVFVVAHIGGLWQRAAAVLFEPESLRWDSAPSRESGEGVAPTIRAGASNGGAGHGARSGDSKDELIVPVCTRSLRAQSQSSHREDTETYIVATLTKNYATHHGRTAGKNGGVAENQLLPVAFQQNASGEVRDSGVAYTLNQNSNPSGRNTGLIQCGMAVRRLTPRECERLMGFPDDFTAIPWRGKPAEQCPDGPRYKALGNSMAEPVVRWIGERIQLIKTL